MARSDSRIHRVSVTLSILSALGLLISCNDSQNKDKAEDEVLKPGSYTSAPAEARVTGAVGASKTKLGLVAVDAEGFTLYVHQKDTTKPARSRCSQECAKEWQPALAPTGMPVAFPGVDANDLGVTLRGNGDKQITLNGHPLYRFSGDKKPGETNGHSRDKDWRIAAPDEKSGKKPARRD